MKRARRPAKRASLGQRLLACWPIAAFGALFITLDWYRGVSSFVSAYYLIASFITLIAYGLDKRAAGRGERRISERRLLLFGFAGGWPGAVAGQQLLRHKSQKPAFRFWFWLSVLLNVGLFVWFVV